MAKLLDTYCFNQSIIQPNLVLVINHPNFWVAPIAMQVGSKAFKTQMFKPSTGNNLFIIKIVLTFIKARAYCLLILDRLVYHHTLQERLFLVPRFASEIHTNVGQTCLRRICNKALATRRIVTLILERTIALDTFFVVVLAQEIRFGCFVESRV